MKRRKYHIIHSWILLICFIAGQYMVYVHQHNIGKGAVRVYSASKDQSQTTVKEKCDLCDVMHHNAMMVAGQVYIKPVTVIGHVFKSCEYSFTSIQLILSGGRAPPTAIYKS